LSVSGYGWNPAVRLGRSQDQVRGAERSSALRDDAASRIPAAINPAALTAREKPEDPVKGKVEAEPPTWGLEELVTTMPLTVGATVVEFAAVVDVVD